MRCVYPYASTHAETGEEKTAYNPVFFYTLDVQKMLKGAQREKHAGPEATVGSRF
jgi:hypothetical protein